MPEVNKKKEVRAFMRTPAITVPPELSLKHALHVMQKHEISHLLVGDAKNMTGIVSKNDILEWMYDMLHQSSGKTYSALSLNTTTVDDIKQSRVVTVNVSNDIKLAAEILLNHQFHAIPVMDNERPVGIITAYDILKGVVDNVTAQ